jgi:hypothetical protein
MGINRESAGGALRLGPTSSARHGDDRQPDLTERGKAGRRSPAI